MTDAPFAQWYVTGNVWGDPVMLRARHDADERGVTSWVHRHAKGEPCNRDCERVQPKDQA